MPRLVPQVLKHPNRLAAVLLNGVQALAQKNLVGGREVEAVGQDIQAKSLNEVKLCCTAEMQNHHGMGAGEELQDTKRPGRPGSAQPRRYCTKKIWYLRMDAGRHER